MVVKKGELTDVGKQEESKRQGEAEKKLKGDILGSLDLTKEMEAVGEVEEPKKKKVVELENEEEELEEEEEAEEESEEEEEEAEEESEEEESEEESEDEDEEDDEVISKKKVQKRINKLIAENKILQQKLEEKEQEKSVAESSDPDTVKLNAMDETGLKATRKAVIKAIRDEADEETLDQLLDLQDKVDKAINTLPDRFIGQQVAEYNKVAKHIVSLGDIPQSTQSALRLKEIATEIYQSQPELRKMVKGQAIALQLAHQHYKALLSKNSGNEKNESLKRQVNTLKRKTALDSSGAKKKAGNSAMIAKLREKAQRGGSYTDKANLVKHDPRFNIDSLIPAEYREE